MFASNRHSISPLQRISMDILDSMRTGFIGGRSYPFGKPYKYTENSFVFILLEMSKVLKALCKYIPRTKKDHRIQTPIKPLG